MDRINFHPVNPVILSKNASEYSLITNYVHRIGAKTKCRSNFQTSSKGLMHITNGFEDEKIKLYEHLEKRGSILAQKLSDREISRRSSLIPILFQ